MRNKVVTIVCIILIVLAVICFGYIFLNSGKKEEKVDEGNNADDTNLEEISPREERYQNIILTSRIGTQLTDLIKYSDMYSDNIIKELDENGISNNAKVLIALDKMNRKQEYSGYMAYSEEYFNNYILYDNMCKVVGDLFINKTVEKEQVDGTLFFDFASDSFIMLPMGYEGGVMNYTLEVPYKIMEYSDRIELLAHRAYITKKVEMQDATSKVENYIYYDKEKTKYASVIEGDSFDTNPNDMINSMIDNNSIDSDSMESVKYVFRQDGELYKIDSFEKIK